MKKYTFMQKNKTKKTPKTKTKKTKTKKIATKNSKMPKVGKDRVEVSVPKFLAVVSSLLK